jgi:hypothetical protein
MFGVTSLVFTGLLILGVFSLRYAEIQRGARFAPSMRKSLDGLAVIVVSFVVRDLPRLFVRMLQYLLIQITDLFSSILLRIVRFLEEKLHVLVHRVRGKKEDLTNGNGPSSNHLADMKSHKEAVSKTIEELEEAQ